MLGPPVIDVRGRLNAALVALAGLYKEAKVRAIDRLLAAKAHSDSKRYTEKNRLLQEALTEAPGDFYVDDDTGKYSGLTHAPTGFRIHAPRNVAALARGKRPTPTTTATPVPQPSSPPPLTLSSGAHTPTQQLSDLNSLLSLESTVSSAQNMDAKLAADPPMPKTAFDAKTVYDAFKAGCRAVFEKQAATFHFQGKVTGVGLRKTLHDILEEEDVGGLAYNDGETGDVYATIDGTRGKRNKVLKRLRDHLDNHPSIKDNGGYTLKPTNKKEKMIDVSMNPALRKQMFERQGFSDNLAKGDGFMKDWITERYRLKDDGQGNLIGRVPKKAHAQLMGEAGVYPTQYTKEWSKFGLGQPHFLPQEKPAPVEPVIKEPQALTPPAPVGAGGGVDKVGRDLAELGLVAPEEAEELLEML